MSKDEILISHKHYLEWIGTLSLLGEEKANTPYAEGKWSPNEIVMHLAEWDRFTLYERMPLLKEGKKFDPFPDFELYNAKAAAQAHKQIFEETLMYAKGQRKAIIEQLEQIDEVEWDKVFYIGNKKITTRSYFIGVIEHDNHHKIQISSISINKKIIN